MLKHVQVGRFCFGFRHGAVVGALPSERFTLGRFKAFKIKACIGQNFSVFISKIISNHAHKTGFLTCHVLLQKRQDNPP